MSQIGKYVYTTRWKYRVIGGAFIALATVLLFVCLSMTSFANRILFSPICLIAIVLLYVMTKKLSDDAAYYEIDSEGFLFHNRYVEAQYRDKSGHKYMWTSVKSITIEEVYVVKTTNIDELQSHYALTSQFGIPAQVEMRDGAIFVMPIPAEILSSFVSQCNQFAGREVCVVTNLN